MKYPFAAMTALGLLGAMTMPAHAANSSVESALESQGDLSMFTQALLNTGVANELNENTEYTVFAPTNAAFARIQQRTYPCFYSAQCRVELAAILRNHLVPRNDSIHDLSKWGGNPVPTIGSRGLYVEEAYKDQYTVEGRNVVSRSEGDQVNLYSIDGVIANSQELAQFRTQPVASIPGTMTEKTVTTYNTPAVYTTTYPAASGGFAVPGGYPSSTVVYRGTRELPDDATETTTVTHTMITE